MRMPNAPMHICAVVAITVGCTTRTVCVGCIRMNAACLSLVLRRVCNSTCRVCTMYARWDRMFLPRAARATLLQRAPTWYPPALRIGRVGGATLRLPPSSHEERLRDEAPGGVGAGQAPAIKTGKRHSSGQMFSPGEAASDVFWRGPLLPYKATCGTFFRHAAPTRADAPPDPPRTHSLDNVRSRPITSDHVRHPTTPHPRPSLSHARPPRA
jgi:hypothetical protein